jgi:hypothetical protein
MYLHGLKLFNFIKFLIYVKYFIYILRMSQPVCLSNVNFTHFLNNIRPNNIEINFKILVPYLGQL